MDGCGVARIDYFVNEKEREIIVNEINTIPGSLCYYLWEKDGIKFNELLNQLIGFALERQENKDKTQYTFSNNILANFNLNGSKG